MSLETLIAGYKRAPANVENATKEWPRTFKCRFIEPGLVHYEDMGTVLVQRAALNKMAQSFVGKPVIDEMHKDARPENFKDIADGVVIRVWTDPVDGWDWCEFLVWDEETMRHCKSREYSVSCAYTPTDVNQKGGTHNNIPYDGEFLNGIYTHLAIVKDPRYEQAKIVHNSKGGKSMFKLFQRAPVEEAEVKNAVLEIDGHETPVPLADAVEAWKAQNALANARTIKDDDVVDIGGKKVTGKELRAAVEKAKKAKNEKKEHDHDEEENCGKGCPAYGAKNSEGEKGMKVGDQGEAISAEKEEGEKRSKKNSKEDDEEKKDKKAENADEEDEEKKDKKAENSKGKHLEEFRHAMEMRNSEPMLPRINTMQERLHAGHLRYGGVKEKEDA